jgi:hypothetical protein
MFLKLLNCHEEESDAKKRKLQRIANGSQEQNTRAENDQGQDGDHSANKGKAQTTVNQFYKKTRARGGLRSDLPFFLYLCYCIQCCQESRICKDGSDDRTIW